MKSKYSDVTLSVPGPRRTLVKLSKLSLKSEKQNSFEITSGMIIGSVWAYSLLV